MHNPSENVKTFIGYVCSGTLDEYFFCFSAVLIHQVCSGINIMNLTWKLECAQHQTYATECDAMKHYVTASSAWF